MSVVKIHHAAILPHLGRFCLWVQSPNRTWMLLSGHWLTRKGAERYAVRAGFFVMADNDRALNAIEEQMARRMIEEIPVDVQSH